MGNQVVSLLPKPISELVAQAGCCSGGHADASTESGVGDGPPGSFLVVLDKNSGERLGLDVENLQRETFLPIRAITGGLAERWNNTHPPHEQMNQGDTIIRVNGVAGTSDQLMTRCKNDKLLRLVVVPASAAVTSVSAGSSAAPQADSQAAWSGDSRQLQQEAGDAFFIPPPTADAGDGLAQLMGMGYSDVQANTAWRLAAGNLDVALGMLTSVNAQSVQSLIGMGFTEGQAWEGLMRSGGDMDRAVNAMMGSGGADAPLPASNGGGPPAAAGGVNPEAVQRLTGMGFSEAQARDALMSANGDEDQALAMCLSSAADSGPGAAGATPAGPPAGAAHAEEKIKQLEGMGFTRQQATDALDGASGDVDRAVAILLG
eukprot:TRINITY_DN30646_c0_g1_i1.p1 TRINITY_DN30646_c0_g1~~TRINITY_DN30646_c0_g1_i1.p1  ORF type:complete len:374 (-),score=82.10 TRINITY_DN30646_c0_g1_i1:330-1451(-)